MNEVIRARMDVYGEQHDAVHVGLVDKNEQISGRASEEAPETRNDSMNICLCQDSNPCRRTPIPTKLIFFCRILSGDEIVSRSEACLPGGISMSRLCLTLKL